MFRVHRQQTAAGAVFASILDYEEIRTGGRHPKKACQSLSDPRDGRQPRRGHEAENSLDVHTLQTSSRPPFIRLSALRTSTHKRHPRTDDRLTGIQSCYYCRCDEKMGRLNGRRMPVHTASRNYISPVELFVGVGETPFCCSSQKAFFCLFCPCYARFHP